MLLAREKKNDATLPIISTEFLKLLQGTRIKFLFNFTGIRRVHAQQNSKRKLYKKNTYFPIPGSKQTTPKENQILKFTYKNRKTINNEITLGRTEKSNLEPDNKILLLINIEIVQFLEFLLQNLDEPLV